MYGTPSSNNRALEIYSENHTLVATVDCSSGEVHLNSDEHFDEGDGSFALAPEGKNILAVEHGYDNADESGSELGTWDHH